MVTAEPRPAAGRTAIVAILLLGLMAISTWAARGWILDDTLIHLRDLRHFAQTGQMAYNLGQPGSGDTSPLYIVLLANLGRFVPQPSWPMMAKGFGIVCWAVDIAMLLWLLPRSRAGKGRSVLLIAAVALMLAVPSATRWMQDGMETSMYLMLALLAAVASWRWRQGKDAASWGEVFCTALIISLPVILRIDGSVLTAAAGGLCLARPRGRSIVALAATSLLLCCAGFFVVWHLNGSLVPDSAIAKHVGRFTPSFLIDAAKSLAVVSPLWVLGALIAAGVALCGPQRPADRLWTGAMALLPIAATMAGGVAVGQHVQGARYFMPQLGFAWAIAMAGLRTGESESAAAPRWVMPLVAGFVVFAAVHLLVTWSKMMHALEPMEFATAAAAPELYKPGARVLIEDIGALGWHTEATIMDQAGLVNGHAAALVHGQPRIALLLKMFGMPDAVMVNDWEALNIDPTIPRHPDFLVLRADNGTAAWYTNTHRRVYTGNNISGDLEWYLWLPSAGPATQFQ